MLYVLSVLSEKTLRTGLSTIFEHADDVVLEWKSYQLDPEFVQPEERYNLEEGLAKSTTDL